MPTATRTDAPRGASPRLLAATAFGVYLLVVVGATTALLDGRAACHTWPACGGEWLVSFSDSPARWAAWLHRLATVAVGGLVLVSTVHAWRRDAPGRVRLALAAVAALYPVQVGLGAVTATTGASQALSAGHLVLAMAIFSGVVLALLWQLEADARESDRASTDAREPEPTPTGASGRTYLPADDTGASSGRHPPTPTDDDPTRSTVRAYLELTKPRLWWLLCLVALAAMGLAAGPSLELGTVLATLAGGVLAIAASGTFNNVLERDADGRMARTDDRPLVEGRIPVRRAVAFGGALTAASVAVFVAYVNVLASALGLLAVLFYSVGYTVVLKPNTSQNVVVGGAAGAFPALIGWAAVTETVGMPALVLGGVIFCWTPAHFYNLALAYRADYARGGFPMLPVVRGEAVTRRHVLLYLGATMLAATVLGTTTTLGPLYAATATVVGGTFLVAVMRLHSERDRTAALRAFHASNAYLGALLVAILVDSILV